mgnify:CR=1 FL=1
MVKKFRDDVFHHDFSIMDHKGISRRRPTKSGAKLRIRGPLDGVVKLEGEGLLDWLHRLCSQVYLKTYVLTGEKGNMKMVGGGWRMADGVRLSIHGSPFASGRKSKDSYY